MKGAEKVLYWILIAVTIMISMVYQTVWLIKEPEHPQAQEDDIFWVNSVLVLLAVWLLTMLVVGALFYLLAPFSVGGFLRHLCALVVSIVALAVSILVASAIGAIIGCFADKEADRIHVG